MNIEYPNIDLCIRTIFFFFFFLGGGGGVVSEAQTVDLMDSAVLGGREFESRTGQNIFPHLLA